jgi:beta-glucanase (GH16 family)
MGTFEYLSFDNLTFSVGDIILGTTPGAPVISAVELTGSSNPTDQAAVNLLVFLQSIDADSDPSNGITITDSARVNASGISLDFHSVDFATQIEAVVTILVPGNTVVSETDALNHFYNTYAELGGTDTFAFDFPGYPPVGGGASFELVFADEFNEGTSPNPDNWTIETGYGPGDSGWGNNEWQLYTDSPDNVRVENGNLVLSALCPVAPCGIRDGSITSGKINTLGKFDFKFGKIVARIKPPVGKAAWPAFWALGTNFPEIGWPRSGEIDFMEIHNFYSDENTTHFTMHWWDEQTESWVFDTQYLTTAESLGDGFHIFEADWNEDRIIGKIDGQTYFTREIEPDTMEEFLEEFYMILNVAMGGTLGSGNEPPAGDEIFPQTMLVDYVRVFQGSDGTLPGGGVLANFDDLIPSTITEFDGAGYAIEAGPEGGDGNALRITRDGGEVYAGVFISVAGIPSDAGEQTISALVYSPTAGTPFVTKLEYGQNEGTPDVQANETVVEGWQTLTWTYTNLEAGQDYNRLVMLPNLGTVGAGESYFIDNITLLGPGDDGGDGDGDGSGTGGDAPTVAAMTPPTRDAANVVSLFSDAYTDVTVDTWKTDWSITAFADVDIAGNATKEYTSLNFVGIETVAEQVDTTGMTHLHVDMWTPNAESLEIKLVDFGANAAYDGPGAGDDTEGSVFLDAESTPALAQGTWVSLDIPLADFEAAGLTDRANIAQLIFAAAPSNEVTLYIDNVYFYTAGDGGTGGGDAPTAAAPTPWRHRRRRCSDGSGPDANAGCGERDFAVQRCVYRCSYRYLADALVGR